MKQVTQTQRDGQVEIAEVPAPLLRPGGLLVQTTHSLISAGTERAKVELAQKSLAGKARARPEQARQVLEGLRQQGPLATVRKINNRLAALQPLGYSCAGIVLAAAGDVTEFHAGQRVACAGAGYANHAEINFVPRNLVAAVPEGVALEQAAYATVGAIAMQGVRQADARLGETVAVLGLGLVGLLAVQILAAAGCHTVGLDPNPARRALASALGCHAVAADADQARAACRSRSPAGADAVLIAAATSSSEPVRLAGELARDRGRVVVLGAVGMDVPRSLYYEKELELRLSRSYGPGRYDPAYEEAGHDYPIAYVRWTEQRNMDSFLHLVAAGAIDLERITTHRFEIDRAVDAYRLITAGTEPYLGVILTYPDREPAAAAAPQAVSAGSTLRTPASVGATAPPRARQATGIALIGAGNFAQDVLLPALKTSGPVDLRWVVTASGLSAQSVARRFGFARATADQAAVWDDPAVAAVVIATRHDAHAALVARALAAGKAVFVEKPLALNADQLAEVTAAYQSAESTHLPLLQVGFNRRFAPLTRALVAFLADNREPLSIHYRVNAGYLPADHWLHDPARGGGRLVGEGCHFVDYLLAIAGSEPVEVVAQALPDGSRYRQDNVVVVLRFANGTLATLHYLANGDKRVPKERIEVFAGGAVGIIDDFRRGSFTRNGRTKRVGRWWSGQDKGYAGEIQAFLQAVRGQGPAPIPFDELVQSTRLTLAAQASLAAGRPLALDSGLPEAAA